MILSFLKRLNLVSRLPMYVFTWISYSSNQTIKHRTQFRLTQPFTYFFNEISKVISYFEANAYFLTRTFIGAGRPTYELTWFKFTEIDFLVKERLLISSENLKGYILFCYQSVYFYKSIYSGEGCRNGPFLFIFATIIKYEKIIFFYVKNFDLHLRLVYRYKISGSLKIVRNAIKIYLDDKKVGKLVKCVVLQKAIVHMTLLLIQFILIYTLPWHKVTLQ